MQIIMRRVDKLRMQCKLNILNILNILYSGRPTHFLVAERGYTLFEAV